MEWQSKGAAGTMSAAPSLSGLHDARNRTRPVATALAASVAASGTFRETAGSGSLGFRHVGGDRIHQRRRQAIIGLEPKLLEARPDTRHLVMLDAGLDHLRHERRESRGRRALLLEQFGMNE